MKKTGGRVAAAVLGAAVAVGNADAARYADAHMSETIGSFLSAVPWRFVGPYRGGRVVAVAGSTADPLVFWFGAAHGGVWKTVDAGMHWTNVSDRYFEFPSVGALDVSLSDPDVLYAGTGEGLQRQYISPGNGVYKSTDGGASWTHTGLEETRHISRLRIHPTNPDVVFVAAMGDMFGPSPDRGIFRTTDGGRTWEHVLFNGEFAGAVDLSIDQRNPNVVFASLNHHVTYPWDEESGGPTTGLFRSADGGDTWTDITKNPGMPGGLVGKIGVAISPADPDRVYAFIEADAGEGGVYRSDDGGESWQMTHQDLYALEIPNSYNHVTADPVDPDVVYIQPINGFQKSVDAGRTFEDVENLNWDPHALWIDPGDTGRMIEGGDGGAAVTLNGGKTWSSLENQPTADLLSLAVDDQQPYWLYAAQNDNSHIAIPGRTDDVGIGWMHYRPLPVGEAGHTAVQPDGSVIYANDRARTFRIDRRTGQAADISVWPEVEFGTAVKDVKYRFYYTFPLILSAHDAGTLYTAAQFVFRSTDEGQNWERISPDLTRNRQEVMGETSGGPISSNASSLFHVSLVRTIAQSPIAKGELWIGTDDSTVQYTRDGGDSWHDVSPPDLPEWTTITGIDISHHAPGTVFISGERHRVSDRTPHLYKTTDYGRTWQRITDGIREHDYSWVIREDPVRPGLLFAGTETGVYVSFDAGGTWQDFQGNLPPVLVMHMAIKGDDLVLATHGRGFWVMDGMSALRELTPEVAVSPAHLFDIAPVERRLRGGRNWTRIKSRNVASNPPRGGVVDYRVASVDDVTLSFLGPDGNVIREVAADQLSVAPGMNRYVWDMQYPGGRLPPSAGALPDFESSDHSPPSRPIAPPGTYRVRLRVGDRVLEKPFEIRRDPRTTASDTDLEAQFELMAAINERVSEVTDMVLSVRETRAFVTAGRRGLDDPDSILRRLDEIEGGLTIWMGSEAHPMMFGPPGLIQKLGRLSGAVISADERPTPAMYAVFDDLSARLELWRTELRVLVERLERYSP